ncbi:hypothetical protein ACFOWA_07755 [Pedobacter lithocola]|uniref:Lipoprotein n=1 Tax=Pedobacter lithocola TaxID=1908239 RepID=A0ABV8PA47_9SPHI
MNTIPKIFACFSIILLAACVTDPEKTKQSEVDPEMKDTTLKYEKIGARD